MAKVIAGIALVVSVISIALPHSQPKYGQKESLSQQAQIDRHEQMFQDFYFCLYEIGKRNKDLEDIKDCLAEQSQ